LDKPLRAGTLAGSILDKPLRAGTLADVRRVLDSTFVSCSQFLDLAVSGGAFRVHACAQSLDLAFRLGIFRWRNSRPACAQSLHASMPVRRFPSTRSAESGELLHWTGEGVARRAKTHTQTTGNSNDGVLAARACIESSGNLPDFQKAVVDPTLDWKESVARASGASQNNMYSRSR
jgi:hypothetical protein